MNGTIVTPSRRRFVHEFKRRAVEMMESGERSARQLGKELGVSERSLCH
jgi:transposase-like protein